MCNTAYIISVSIAGYVRVTIKIYLPRIVVTIEVLRCGACINGDLGIKLFIKISDANEAETNTKKIGKASVIGHLS